VPSPLSGEVDKAELSRRRCKRACAVLAVLLYHADVSFLPGGFLGVELFFALSGYLITSLLLSERRAHGKTDLLGFWLRRARRLFPALGALLLLVPALTALCAPEELYRLRDDLTGALLYVTNWQLIHAQQSYFAQVGRPSLLQHLWSLAVEEQFYLLWPLVFSGLLARGRARLVALGLSAAALGSLLWMGHLYDPNVDPSRVYYGSDTRAFGLLIGAALAFALDVRPPWLSDRQASLLACLGALTLAVCFVGLDELDTRVYPGGFLAVDLATCLLIVVSRAAPNVLPVRALASRSLVAIGKRSYGLYLWHWPVFALSRPELDTSLSGPSLLALRLALTALLAEASYRWVECPLREPGAFARLVSLARGPARFDGQRLRASGVRWSLASGALSIALLCSFSTRALIAAQEPPREDIMLTAPAQALTLANTAPAAMVSPLVTSPAGQSTGSRPRVLAIGDSVMLGARKFLVSPEAQIEVDAAVGRTPPLTLALLQKRAQTLRELDVVIIHLGNNGPFQAEQFDRMMEMLSEVPRVVFVTPKVPRRLGVYNNRTIREGVERHPRVALLDWFEASKDHGEWFKGDGLHLRERGATAYAQLLAAHYSSR
jgi:peptidoglycan/LPS O-acetylase OafA/YrhL